MKAVHADCPRCGAAIMLDGDRRISRCDFCGSKLLVEVEGATPAYWFKPLLDRDSAKRAVFKSLADPMMPADLKRSAVPESFSLVFIPFYYYRARRVGLLTVKDVRLEDMDPGKAETRFDKPIMDSKVLYNPFIASGIATELPGWGLNRVDIGTVLESAAIVPEVYSVSEMQKIGEVYETTMPVERFVDDKTRLGETKEVAVKLRILPENVSIYYYPVWLARYTYQGIAYRATVDAITGALLLIRAPQSDRFRLPVMLAILASLAWPVSKLAAFILHSSRPGAYATMFGYLFMIAWPLTLTVLCCVLFVLYITWMNYRYPGEVVITPGGRDIEKIGRPAESWLDRIFERLDELLQEIFRKATKLREM